jgi:NAD(P)-dependent dehydrogenase (short-subunit alcohol dehydrogenase family)
LYSFMQFLHYFRKNNFMWSNHVFIITGAGSGIGKELSVQALEGGATVFAIDVRDTGLQELKTNYPQTHVHQMDIGDKEAIVRFAEETIPKLGQKTLVLVNNAGVGLLSGKFEETALEDIEWLININFWGVVRMTKAFYPYLLQQNKGHIVNVSSVFGLAGIMNQSAYSPSKFAVRGFTETLRMELLHTGIKTHSVHPGGIDTNIIRNSKFTGKHTSEVQQKRDIKSFSRAAMTTSIDAAKVILDGVAKNMARILIGKDAKMMDKMVRLFPSGYSTAMRKQIERAFPE